MSKKNQQGKRLLERVMAKFHLPRGRVRFVLERGTATINPHALDGLSGQ